LYPGNGWFRAFMKRNPGLAFRTPQSLAQERASVSRQMVEEWMQGVKDDLKLDWPNDPILDDGRRIFNADESGFPISPKSRRVLAALGQKQVYQRGSGKHEQITVMVCANANGEFMNPRILFPGQRLRDIGMRAFPDAEYSTTDNGWMDSETFLVFLTSLNDFVLEKQIKKPVIIFVDGHTTHCSFAAAQYCHDHSIILYCLIPHSSHITQPLDVGVFGPMKATYKKCVAQWQLDNPDKVPSKHFFPEVFFKTWQEAAVPGNCISGFRHSGIYPFMDKLALDRFPSTTVTAIPMPVEHPAPPMNPAPQDTVMPSEPSMPHPNTARHDTVPVF
jgi:hypothetical protein